MTLLNPEEVAECDDCGVPLDMSYAIGALAKEPCPRCGSHARSHGTAHNGRLQLTIGGMRITSRPPGGGRPVRDSRMINGADHSTGRRVKRRRVVDRASDEYYERVIDVESGETIHECSEPLSQHRGHGTERLKKPRTPK